MDKTLVHTLEGVCSDIESWARLKQTMVDYVKDDEAIDFDDFKTEVEYMEDGSFAFKIEFFLG